MKPNSHKLAKFLVLVTTISLLAAQCGGATSPPPTSSPAEAAQAVPTPVPTEAPQVAPTPTAAAQAMPTATPTAVAQVEQESYETIFPLPDDVQNFTGEGGESPVNFQTSLSLDEVVEFYRQAFTEQGLTERTILTEVSDTGFSMVFDGWPNGKAIVIQGVDFGTSTNVNIRFEDV